MTVPIVLMIDVEPDSFFLEPHATAPEGPSRAFAHVARWRDRFQAATGRPMHVTWLVRVDPQIETAFGAADWLLSRYAKEIERLRAAGDDIGYHVHPYRWLEDVNAWVEDFANAEWVEHSIRTSHEAFRRHMGQSAVSASMGDHWFGNVVTRLWSELGIRHDLSLNTGRPARQYRHHLGRMTGEIVDTCGLPRIPWVPSGADFRVPREDRADGLHLFPLATLVPGRRTAPRFNLIKQLRKLRSLGRPHSGSPNLMLLREGPRQFGRSFNYLLTDMRRPMFVFGIRSSLFLAPAAVTNLEHSYEFLLGHAQAARFAVMRPDDALQALGD